MGEIWVVDDEPREARILAELLEARGRKVRVARSWRDMKAWFPAQPEGIVLDLVFDRVPAEDLLGDNPVREGIAILRELNRRGLRCPVLFLSSYLEPEVLALARHAYPRELLYPREKDSRVKWETLVDFFVQKLQEQVAQQELFARYGEAGFWTASPRMLPVLQTAETVVRRLRAGKRFVTLLITGETGVGKEQLALAIHRRAFGSEVGFGVVLLQTLERGLVWVELAGAAAGAYTDLRRERRGILDLHQTVLLDEIGDLPLEVQEKILRLVDTGRYRPVGKEEREFRGLLVFATNRDLDRLVTEGRFRQDLLHRLRSHYWIRIPPLRERIEDLWLILEKLLGRPVTFTEKARAFLESYPWPGNVRNLVTFARTLQDLLAENPEMCLDLGIVAEAFDRIFRAARPRPEAETCTLADLLQRILQWMETQGVSADTLWNLLLYQATEVYGTGRARAVLGLAKSTYYRYQDDLRKQEAELRKLLGSRVPEEPRC